MFESTLINRPDEAANGLRRTIVLKTSSTRRQYPASRRSGFTLIEMMVSVALVLIMMSMFASVFVMSTKSLSQQRGIAENDQRARLLSSTIRNDLDGRTFRDVLPFRPNEDTRQLGHSLARRSGYFEIDEGNPTDDTDDVLQFTTCVNIKLQYSDNTPFVGKALPLSKVGPRAYLSAFQGYTFSLRSSQNNSITDTIVINSDSGYFAGKIAAGSRIWSDASTPLTPYIVSYAFVPDTASGLAQNTNIVVNVAASNLLSATNTTGLLQPPTNLWLSENEPEFDDGSFNDGATSASAMAEVSYFMRNGNLYRRVLLIRDTATNGNPQPTWSNGSPILWGLYTASQENYGSATNSTSSTFWRDFDCSAFYYPGKTLSGGGTNSPGIRFHDSRESLSNSSQAEQVIYNETALNNNPPGAVSTFPLSLGLPNLRFGHAYSTGYTQDMSNTLPGNDGIYGTSDDGATIIATRFVLQECANTAFGYPGNIDNGNPFTQTGMTIAANGLATPYSAKNYRRGEDILMANVLTFDVKVWDPISTKFVDVGDATNPSGPFGQKALGRFNRSYSPNYHYKFDTWHPNATAVGNGQPPYFPITFGADGAAGISGVDDDNDGNTDTMTDPIYGGTIPDWKEAGSAGSDDIAFSLSAIQIRINYRDISSNQIRQMTIVQSLNDRVKAATTTIEPPEE